MLTDIIWGLKYEKRKGIGGKEVLRIARYWPGHIKQLQRCVVHITILSGNFYHLIFQMKALKHTVPYGNIDNKLFLWVCAKYRCIKIITDKNKTEWCYNYTGSETLYEVFSVRLLTISTSGFWGEERTLHTLEFRRHSWWGLTWTGPKTGAYRNGGLMGKSVEMLWLYSSCLLSFHRFSWSTARDKALVRCGLFGMWPQEGRVRCRRKEEIWGWLVRWLLRAVGWFYWKPWDAYRNTLWNLPPWKPGQKALIAGLAPTERT